MVEREGLLEAVGRHVARGEHGAGVVREHVDAPVGVEELAGKTANLVHPLQVGHVLVHRRAATGAPRHLRGRPYARRVTADDAELGAADGELDGGRVPDPARGAREDDRGHVGAR